jgi:hypothetical protein
VDGGGIFCFETAVCRRGWDVLCSWVQMRRGWRLVLGEIFSLLSIRHNSNSRTVEGSESGGEGQERYRRGATVFIERARHRLIVASTLDLAGLSRMDWCSSASMCCTPVPGQSYRPSSSGVTQTVFRARKAYRMRID